MGSDDGFSVGLTQIVYNLKSSAVRARFTISHELGHILLGHNSEHRVIDFNSKDPNEIQANAFASELLVPLKFIKKEFLASSSLGNLCKKYWVSKEMLTWRLKETGLYTKLGSWE